MKINFNGGINNEYKSGHKSKVSGWKWCEWNKLATLFVRQCRAAARKLAPPF